MKIRIGRAAPAWLLTAAMLQGPLAHSQEPEISIVNPRGELPPIRLVPMAPRMDTLEGKTVYLIAVSFAVPLMPELQKLLSERYPRTTWVLKNKAGSYFDDDPKLWAEAREKSSAAIMGVGH